MDSRRPRRVSRFSLSEAWANSAGLRRRWRIWSGLGVLCLGVALVTLASGASQQRSAPVPSTPRMEASCTALSSIESRFNATPIGEGNTIWFNSAIRVAGLGSGPTSIYLNDSKIAFAANGRNYNLAVPAATVVFDPSANVASTGFDGGSNRWVTIVPGGVSGRVFLSGLAFPVPAGGLPGGIDSVTWSAAFSTDTPGVTAKWQWAAAAYREFGNDYNALAVKPVDDEQAGEGTNRVAISEGGAGRMESAGKPASLEAFLTGGGSGEGESNFTGSFSATGAMTPCPMSMGSGQATHTSRTTTTTTLAPRSNVGTSPLVTTGLGITKTCPSIEPPGASFSCSYTVQNLDPDNTVINLAVTNTVPFPGGSRGGHPLRISRRHSCDDAAA